VDPATDTQLALEHQLLDEAISGVPEAG